MKIVNIQLSKWLGTNPERWLSYMVNNNPQGVIDYLQSNGAVITDTNQNGTIETDELFAALKQFATVQFGSVAAFVKASANYINHNYRAPRRWNLYK